MKIKQPEKKTLFYKINYLWVSFSFLFLIIFLMFLLPGQTRLDSFSPYAIILGLLGMSSAIIHLILKRERSPSWKNTLAIAFLILMAFFLSLHIFAISSNLGVLNLNNNAYYEFEKYEGCDVEPEFHCIHYSKFGFGECDVCERRFYPKEEHKVVMIKK